jgi:two-component system sensor histidine kinase HydH
MRRSSCPYSQVKALHQPYDSVKKVLLFFLIASITAANCFIRPGQVYAAFLLQALFFLPLLLSVFWYGFRGSILACAGIVIFHFPIMIGRWQEFMPNDFERLLEVAIYMMVALALGFMRDRELERLRRLTEIDRLVAMGRTVSSLAHDMKTPLVAIGGFARQVWEKLPEADPDRERLSLVIRETQRLEHMVQDMLDFSGNLRLTWTEENIPQIAEESLAVVKDIAREKKVLLQSRIDGQIPSLTCDGKRIKQMLINLLTNAIDSSPEGGLVTVQVRFHGDRLMLEVVDCGAGIPRQQRNLVFDPFFTTKAHGTGLGLPIVKKIVEAHQGGLEILDNPDRGLTFRILLPLPPDEGSP